LRRRLRLLEQENEVLRRHRHLGRTHLPPTPPPSGARTPRRRIRDHHDPTGHPSGLTQL
jgi:hypothetical protein